LIIVPSLGARVAAAINVALHNAQYGSTDELGQEMLLKNFASHNG
jgi:hypothetical protein